MQSINVSLNRYCEIGDAIKALSTQIKELKIEYKDIETVILETMEKNDTDVYNYNTKNCVFKRKKKISKSGLNKESVTQGISIMFKDPEFQNCKTDNDKADKGADIILNSREEKETYVLERKTLKT